MLKECTFIPKIQRVLSQKGFAFHGLHSLQGFQTSHNIEILSNTGDINEENKTLNIQGTKGAEASLTCETLNNQKNISLSMREKQQFSRRLKDDINKINSIQKMPQINAKSKRIVEAKNLKQNQVSQNIFDKLYANKEQSKPTSKYPFKPQINPATAISYIPSIDKSQKMLDIALKKHEKLLLKLKEKQSNYELNSVKKNEMNGRFQIRKFNKELDKLLSNLKIYTDSLTKDNTKDLLLMMNFISKRQTRVEEEKFEDLWTICKGKNEDNARIENIKTVLIALSGLIQLPLIDSKEETTSANKFYKLESDDFQLKPLCLVTKEKQENYNYTNNDKDFLRQFNYDNEGILLLSYKNILYLKKRFISFYCNRFSRIGKRPEKLNQKDSKSKEEKGDSNLKYRVITSQKKKKYQGKAKPILMKSPNNERSGAQASKKDIIVAIASCSPNNNHDDRTNRRIDKALQSKTIQRIHYLNRIRMKNRSAEAIDFEKARNNLTFSPEIHGFSLTKKEQSKRITKFEEMWINRIRMGHKSKSLSSKIILSESKEGITSLNCDNTYRKYWNQFKSIDESDKVLKKLVKKYAKGSIPKKDSDNSNLNKLSSKIRDGISLELLNFYEENQTILASKKLEEDKSSNVKEEVTPQIANNSSDSNIANQTIAVIKINNLQGVNTITMNRNSQLSEIASKIANENSIINRFN